MIKIKSKDSEDLKAMKVEFLLKLSTADSCREIMNMLLNLLPSTPRLNSLIVQVNYFRLVKNNIYLFFSPTFKIEKLHIKDNVTLGKFD